MNLIYKCKLIIYNDNERKLVEINSILGLTKKEIKNIYASKNYHIEKFIINSEDFIYNHLKNKGYTVYNIYIPVSKSRRLLDDVRHELDNTLRAKDIATEIKCEECGKSFYVKEIQY